MRTRVKRRQPFLFDAQLVCTAAGHQQIDSQFTIYYGRIDVTSSDP